MIGGQSRRCRRALTVIGCLLAGGGLVAATSQAAGPDNSDTGGDRATGIYALTAEEIETIRSTIEPFADPADAVAAGWIDLDLCVDMMGDHYADPATFGVLDAAAPEALVYAIVEGTEQLVAVEWVSTAPGEVLGIPLHLNHDLDVWVLHAWVGLDNPSGMLADHHPDVGACPA